MIPAAAVGDIATIVASTVGLLGGIGGLATAVYNLAKIRVGNANMEADTRVKEADADRITQDAWAKMVAVADEKLARAEVVEARLRTDLDAQRASFEERMTSMQRRIDRLEAALREHGLPSPA